jgi:membrane-associated protease RseP (regulator of RpoE activity)
MSQNNRMPTQVEPGSGVTVCANCRTPMPLELRFCRNCGFRLGEGSAEYTETVRLPLNRADKTSVASHQPLATAYGVPGPMVPGSANAISKRARKMSGMTWMFIGLLIFFLVAAAFTAVVRPIRRAIPDAVSVPPPPPQSYLGVHTLKNDEGGVTFEKVEPPGGPADKAGLFGGDMITSFDGQTVRDKAEMNKLLERTPIGKTVEVIFIRDGEIKTTKLTTISEEDSERLAEEFRKRPQGRGLFGFEDREIERVAIPGTKIFGVRVDEITPNRPADLAGIKAGDVIIEFDKAPIRTTEELRARVNRAIPYSTVVVVVMRGADRYEIPVKMGKR